MTDPGTPPVIGVIGGSGVYEIDGLTHYIRKMAREAAAPATAQR